MKRMTFGDAVNITFKKFQRRLVFSLIFGFVLGGFQGAAILALVAFLFTAIRLGMFYLECDCGEITSQFKNYCPNCAKETPGRYRWGGRRYQDQDDDDD